MEEEKREKLAQKQNDINQFLTAVQNGTIHINLKTILRLY